MQGDDSAFEAIYNRYAVKLLAMACRKVADRSAAQDMVQDIFMNLFRMRSNLPEIQSLKGYLFGSLRNAILNYYHRESLTRRHHDILELATQRSDDSFLQKLYARELSEHIAGIITKLPPQRRLVFQLSREEHLSNRQIAERLNISENTVEQHMRKALQFIRFSLSESKLDSRN
ncbi:RNA polymerase sigma-70 factor [Dyadobacter fermentans]